MNCPHATSGDSPVAMRLVQLEAVLAEHADLWRPQPYKLVTPDWCARHPRLTADLLRLADAEVDALMTDDAALIGFVERAIPPVGKLAALLELPASPRHEIAPADAHFAWDIPGRKLAQIESFALAVGMPVAPVVEWCAGKGHLGRRLAQHSCMAVCSLEIDPRLCEAGRLLAQRARASSQRFVTVDVLGPFVRDRVRASHAIALHACGDLHTALIRQAVHENAAALHLVPCCYHKTADAAGASLSGATRLAPTLDDLRLAGSDMVTAAPREIQAGRLKAAWILGFRAMVGVDRLSMRLPGMLPGADASQAGYRHFCEQTAAANGLSLPAGVDWLAAECESRRLEHRARRLALPRRAFRRALELWLAFDRAHYLEQCGYRVAVSVFCPRALTPRNVLIAAER